MDDQRSRLDGLEALLDEAKYFSPVHPKYFMRLAGALLLASFLLFSSFLV